MVLPPTSAMRSCPTRTLLVVLLGAGLVGCAGTGSVGAAPRGATPAPPQALDRLEALYRARADSARMDVHPADVDFMTGMIAHHAQALRMSYWAPERAESAGIRTLAARIVNAQKDEIAVMQRWLRERDRPVPQVDERGQVHGHGEHMHMAGMLSEDQLARLEATRGETFDSLYLRSMIPHHQGAVTMVHELFATDGAALDDFVFKLASDIQVDQTSEVARMQRMLDAMRAREPEAGPARPTTRRMPR